MNKALNQKLKEKLKELPRAPGVYFHKSANGEVIYVGKAAVLRNRVRQYFRDPKDFDIKTQALVAEIVDTDWIETESEIDALFLESEMVKRYMPRFNILLRDDKSQAFVRINMRDTWPTVTFTRNPDDDGASYIGPFYSAYALKKAVRYLRRVFPYYTRDPNTKNRSRLEEQIGLAPDRTTTSAEYKANLRQLIKYIEGGRVAITKDIERDMKRAAREQDFELAAIYRNKLKYLQELQRRIMFGDREYLDISKDKALVQVKQILGLDTEPVRIEGYDIAHISASSVVASMVVFTNGVSDRTSYRKFKLSRQVNDDAGNIREVITRRFSDRNLKDWGIPDLVLIDGGKPQLSSALSALESSGQAVPVISIAKRNDEIVVKSPPETSTTDFIKTILENVSPKILSIIADGDYAVINLHPGRTNAGGHSRNLRGGDSISQFDDLLKLIQRIRDESHRFAQSYHSKLRAKQSRSSILDDIPGIGPATKRKLMKHFGSVRAISLAKQSEVAEVIGATRAKQLQRHLIK